MGKKAISPWLDFYATPDRRMIINPYAFPVSGGFSPPDIPGLNLWLKADAITGLSDGDPVSTWLDSSGFGNDATQSGANRPTYKTSIVNALPVLRFDGVNSYMSGPISLSQPITAFAVISFASGTDYQFILDGSTNRIAMFRNSVGDPSGQGQVFFAGSSALVTRANDTSWHVIGYTPNNASSIASIDGAVTTGLSVGTNGLGPSYLLSAWSVIPSGVFGRLSGDVAEIIIYDSALSTGNRQAVEDYLGTKYGITITH